MSFRRLGLTVRDPLASHVSGVVGTLVAVLGLFAIVSAQEGPPAAFITMSTTAGATTSDPGVIRQQRVNIGNPRILADQRASDVLELSLFRDMSVRARRDRLGRTASGVTWSGTLDGYPDSRVIFTLSGDTVAGSVYAPFGFFRIDRTRTNDYMVQQIDPSTISEVPGLSSPSNGVTTEPRLKTFSDNGHTVDLIVFYTPAAAAGWGSDERRQAAIDLAVSSMNQALSDSQVDLVIRLVNASLVNYVESPDNLTNLSNLAKGDGILEQVHALRAKYEADMMLLVVGGGCGASYYGQPSHDYAISVVSRTCLNTSRTSYGLGEGLGLLPDWYTLATPRGASASARGFVSLAGRFTDIMGAGTSLCKVTNTQCTPVLAFSNPRKTVNGRPFGVPVGTDATCQPGDSAHFECDADAAATLNVTGPQVANFRDSSHGVTGVVLMPGTSLRTPDGRFRLTYQPDGDLVEYDDSSGSLIWRSNTGGTIPGIAAMQSDGNFVVRASDGTVSWASNTAAPGASLVLQDDGNLVVFSPYGQPLWAGFSDSGLVGVPGAAAGPRPTVGDFSGTWTGRYRITSCNQGASRNYAGFCGFVAIGATGSLTLQFQQQGNTVSGTVTWRGLPWGGTGPPETHTDSGVAQGRTVRFEDSDVVKHESTEVDKIESWTLSNQGGTLTGSFVYREFNPTNDNGAAAARIEVKLIGMGR